MKRPDGRPRRTEWVWVGLLAVPLLACGAAMTPTPAAVPVAAGRALPSATTVVRVHDFTTSAASRPAVASGQPVAPTPVPDVLFRQVPIQLPPPPNSPPVPAPAPRTVSAGAPAAPAPPPAAPATPAPAAPPATPTPPNQDRPPSAEEASAYGQYAASALRDLDRGLVALEAQTEKAGANPTLVVDPAWRESTARALSVVRGSGEALRNYSDPLPPSLLDLGASLASLGSDASDLSDAYEAAVDVADPTLVSRAGATAAALSARRHAGTERVQALGFG